jgi:hypothetical protein
MTAVYVLLAGAMFAIVVSFLSLTVVAYVGRALTRDRVRNPRVRIPRARVVNR